MLSLIGFFVLLALNLWIGINDVRNGHTTKRAAFTWFVVGWLAFHVLIVELLKIP